MSSDRRLAPALLVLVGSLAGCHYDEGIIVQDMSGKIVVPRAAATRTFNYQDGTSQEVTDVRLIGPVYLGLYPATAEGIAAYPAPVQGPVLTPGVPGDSYPYGGTSVGDIRFACMQFLTCKVVSGRYQDFDAMVDWFTNVVKDPITDANGDVVTNGDYIAETCMDLMNYTSESEIRLTATEDVNGDGKIDAGDLDFVENSDGDFEASFTFWQQEYFQSPDDGTGFTLWGWMDAPSEVSYKFNTCDPDAGYQETQYNRNFFAGRPYRDLLNKPTSYISSGDFVSSEPIVYSSPDETPTITIDFPVE